MDTLLDELKELREISKILRQDELDCMESAVKDNSQFWWRMYVRSFFAHVEGVTYRLKQQSLSAAEEFRLIKLSHEEIAIINEESYELTENAQIKKRPIYNPIDRNIRFTFDIALRAYGTKLDLKLGNDNKWNNFKKSIKVRNRITHPKNSSDLLISDEEKKHLLEAVDWFSETLKLLINALLDSNKNNPPNH